MDCVSQVISTSLGIPNKDIGYQVPSSFKWGFSLSAEFPARNTGPHLLMGRDFKAVGVSRVSGLTTHSATTYVRYESERLVRVKFAPFRIAKTSPKA